METALALMLGENVMATRTVGIILMKKDVMILVPCFLIPTASRQSSRAAMVHVLTSEGNATATKTAEMAWMKETVMMVLMNHVAKISVAGTAFASTTSWGRILYNSTI